MKTSKGKIYPLGTTVTERGVNFSVAVECGKKCERFYIKQEENLLFGTLR